MATLVQELKKKYGVSKVYKWSGWADQKREKVIVDIMERVAKSNQLSPSFLYTIACGEGFGLLVDLLYKGSTVNVNNPVSGFGALGLDHFSSDFNRVKKYLPSDFNKDDEFWVIKDINEKGEVVFSADFKNVESGILGLSATLKHREMLFLAHGRLLKDSEGNPLKAPDEDQKVFWTYVYFQGEGRALKYLNQNGDYDYSRNAPAQMKQIRQLSLERLAAWKYIQAQHLFSK